MHTPWINIIGVSTSDTSAARVVAFSVDANGSGGVGPYPVANWVQLHGLSDTRLTYTLVPAAGGLGNVTPDAAAVPVSGFPLMLPAGASLIINNNGAGTRAYTASVWPAGV